MSVKEQISQMSHIKNSEVGNHSIVYLKTLFNYLQLLTCR